MEDVNMAEEHQTGPYKKASVNSEKFPRPIDCSKCEFLCNTKIGEQTRIALCKEFHGLNLERQRYFILRLVTEKDSQEGRDNIKQTSGDKYEFFIFYQREQHRVCKEFFLATLSISPEVVKNILSGRNEYGFFVEGGKQGEHFSSEKPPKALPVFHEDPQQKNITQKTLPVNEMYEKYLKECKKHATVPLNEIMFQQYINKSLKYLNQEQDEDQSIEIFEMYTIKNPKFPDSRKCSCKNSCDVKISKEERTQIHKEFDKLSLPCRNDFLLSMVQECNNTLRTYSLISKHQKHRVCKIFFQHTLGIGPVCIDNVCVHQSEFGMFKEREGIKCVRPKRIKKNMKLVKEHIESFPQIYTAINQNPPKKLYFDESFTIKGMYRLYVHKCAAARLEFVSETIFKRYMKRNYDYTVKPIGERRYNRSKLVSTPPNTNPTIVKYELDIDDTNNEYSQDSYTVEPEEYSQEDYEVEGGTEVVAGTDCFTMYDVKSELSDGLE